MPNYEKIDNSELKKLVSEVFKEKNNITTKGAAISAENTPTEPTLQETGGRDVEPKGSEHNLLQEDGPSGPPMVTRATAEGIPAVYASTKRMFNSWKRKADRLVNFKGSGLSQAVKRIDTQSENLETIEDIKGFYSIFNEVCYENLTYSVGTSYSNMAWMDPGAYCLNKKIKTWLTNWHTRQRPNMLKTLSEKNHSDREKYIYKTLYHFSTVFRALIKTGSFPRTPMRSRRDGVPDTPKIVENSRLRKISSTLNRYYLYKNKKLNPDDSAKLPSILDFYPIVSIGFVYDLYIQAYSSSFIGDVFFGRNKSLQKALMDNPVSALENSFRNDIIVSKIKEGGDFQNHWKAFSANAFFDPYGEKDYSFYYNSMQDFDKKAKYNPYELNVADLATQFGFSILTYAAITKIVTAGVALTVASGPGAPISGIATAVIGVGLAIISTAAHWFGFWDEKDEIIEELNKMKTTLSSVSALYDEGELSDDIYEIDTEKMAELDREYFESIRKIFIFLHQRAASDARYGVEDKDMNFKAKLEVQTGMSQLILALENKLESGSTMFYRGQTRSNLIEKDKQMIQNSITGIENSIKMLNDSQNVAEKLVRPREKSTTGVGVPVGGKDFEKAGIGGNKTNTLEEQSNQNLNFVLRGGNKSRLIKEDPDQAKEKAKIVLDRWKSILKELYDFDATSDVSDTYKKVREIKDVIENLNVGLSKGSNDRSSDSIVDYAYSYNKWFKRTFASYKKYNSEKDLKGKAKYYYALSRDYSSSAMGLKSKKFIYSKDKDGSFKNKYAWLIIGPAAARGNTQFFVTDSETARKKILSLSELRRSSDGSVSFETMSGLGVNTSLSADLSSKGSYTQFSEAEQSFLKSNNQIIKQKYRILENDVINSSDILISYLKPESTGGREDIDTVGTGSEDGLSGGEIKSVNLMLRYHLKMIVAINNYFNKKREALSSSREEEKQNLDTTLDEEINTLAKSLHFDEKSVGEDPEYDKIVSRLRSLGAAKIKQFEESVQSSKFFENEASVGNFNLNNISIHFFSFDNKGEE